MGVDFRMNDSARQAMRESLLEDVQTEIEMAREGQIPPSWQYDRLEDLKQAVAKHWISEQEYSDLCAQFEAAVRSTRQITDQEYDRQIVADSAGNTLFCWNGKGNSIVSIDRDGDGFAVTVYLDAPALGETRRACAEQCIHALQEYAAAHDFTPARVTEQQCRTWCPPNRISTREEAFGCALAMLQSYIPK